MKRETRFTSQRPAHEIMSKIEEAAKPLGFNVHKRNYKVMIYVVSWPVHINYFPRAIFNVKILSQNERTISILQMKLQGDKSGRKGHLSVATEVLTKTIEIIY